MTTNRPEVVAWIWDYSGRNVTTDYSRALELAEPPYPIEVEPLIRLSASEASRAADKARIDELLGLLRMTSRVLRSGDPAISDTVWCDDGAPETLADRIDEALNKDQTQ